MSYRPQNPHWRYPTGPEELLVTRTPGHLGKKTRKGTETKQQNNYPQQRQHGELTLRSNPDA